MFRRKKAPEPVSLQEPPVGSERSAPLPIINTTSGLQVGKKPRKVPKKRLLIAGLGVVVLAVLPTRSCLFS